ncbi:mitoguardin-like [Haliotis cracherodii]|uniref:mitoguardin-like n=1 Tax=Haliotis cracherodii TaxID=6455 RepID=UPI0039E730CD
MFKNLAQIQQRLPALPQLSRQFKYTAFSVSLGIALIGLIAAMLRRRRGRRPPTLKKGNKHKPGLAELQRKYGRIRKPAATPNGDVPSRLRDSVSPSGSMRSLIQQRSLSSSLSSLGGASSSTVTHPGVDPDNMSPLQLCQLGMENLGDAVALWEDAVMKLSYVDDQPYPAIPDPDTAALQHRLEHLLDLAYRMQDNYERQCERHADQVALESALSAFAEIDRLQERQRSLDDSSSDQDSFVSATDMANLADLEKHRELFRYLPLYEAGLLELKYGNISCRSLRTEMAECLSDTEFLAKLFGLRLAFEHIFKDDAKREWWRVTGRRLIGDMLIQAEKDPEEFYVCFDKMVTFVEVPDSWDKIEEELKGRGVKTMSFYDIVLEFIMMDAFDDLDNPPASVVAVVQNRWLSNGFKETALATAVWSVLKAKRRMLKFSNGFISHFYGVTEHVSPVLAWGFLGPESDLKHMCNFFRELILGFICDMFSFDKVRFTTVEELAADIMKLAEQRSQQAEDRLSVS